MPTTKSEYMVTLNGYKIKDNEAVQGLSISGKTITITKRDGTTSTITTQDTTYSAATTSKAGLMSAADKTKLDGVATGAEVNQNAFSNIKIGSTTISASAKTDTFEVAGTGLITVTPDATNKKFTISTSANNYTLPDATTSKKGGVIVGDGLAVSSGTISNAGVVSVAEGTSDGTISVKTGSADAVNVAVHGLGSNAYTSTAFAPLASPALTGTPTAPTATAGTNSNQIATTAFVKTAVDAVLGANDAMIFKGTIGTGGTVAALPAAHEAGWTYKVATAGTYAGYKCEVGDMIICVTDGSATNNAHWTVIQTNIDGAVTGPTSATAGNIAVFGANGQIIADGGIAVPTNAVFTDTTYSAGTGLSLSGTTFNHSNSVTAGSNVGNNSTTSLAYGGTFVVPKISYDAQGHITSAGTVTLTLPASDNTDTSVTSAANHYTPAAVSSSALTAASGTATDLATATSAVNVFTGLSRDSKGHVTGGTYKALSVGTMGAATSSAAGKKGLVPAPAAGDQAKFLTGAGTWVAPTSYSAMTGATASAAGAGGLVPAPAAGAQAKFLRGDATWADIALSITDDGAGNIVFGLATE